MSLLTCSAVPPLLPSPAHDPGEVCGEGLGQPWDGGFHPVSGSDLLVSCSSGFGSGHI